MRAVRISTDTLRATRLSLRVIYAADANGWRRQAYRRAAKI